MSHFGAFCKACNVEADTNSDFDHVCPECGTKDGGRNVADANRHLLSGGEADTSVTSPFELREVDRRPPGVG